MGAALLGFFVGLERDRVRFIFIQRVTNLPWGESEVEASSELALRRSLGSGQGLAEAPGKITVGQYWFLGGCGCDGQSTSVKQRVILGEADSPPPGWSPWEAVGQCRSHC